MKSYEESYKYIGQVVQMKECENLENGHLYLLMEHRDDHDTFLDIKNSTIEIEEGEYTFNVIHTPPRERLELMYEALVTQVMQLTAEGWVVDSDNHYFDLTPYVAKLKIIEMLLERSYED